MDFALLSVNRLDVEKMVTIIEYVMGIGIIAQAEENIGFFCFKFFGKGIGCLEIKITFIAAEFDCTAFQDAAFVVAIQDSHVFESVSVFRHEQLLFSQYHLFCLHF